MNCWATLGVEPQSDQKTIKRAYVRLLKDVHPEEHQNAFMALRAAYEQAIALSGKTNSIRQPADQLTVQKDSQQSGHSGFVTGSDVQPSPVTPAHTGPQNHEICFRLNVLIDQFIELLGDRQRLARPEKWEVLFLTPELTKLETRLQIGSHVLPALLRTLQDPHAPVVPPELLVKLDDRFLWSTDQSIFWRVPEEEMLKLTLLLTAARRSAYAVPRREGLRWLCDLLLNCRGTVALKDFLLGQAIVLGLGAFLVGISPFVQSQPGQTGINLIWWVLLYSVVVMCLKRAADMQGSSLAQVLPMVAVILVPFQLRLRELLIGKHTVTADHSRARMAYRNALREIFRRNHRPGFHEAARDYIINLPGFVLRMALAIWVGAAVLYVLHQG